MKHKDLRSFINQLHREQEIVEITTEVDPYLEIPEIHRRVIDEGGPALLFTKVKGSKFPVVTNLFGTKHRVDMAIGPRPEELTQTAVNAMHNLLPPKLSNLWRERGWLLDLAKAGTKRVKSGPVLQARHADFNMQELPALTGWQEDGGPFITLPLVYTEHPVTKEHNLGMYRMQIFGPSQTGIHWQIHKGGGFHHYEAEQKGENLPVTVFLGGPPALVLSAIAPLPEMLPELLFTSFLLGDKLDLVDVPEHPHALIAGAEFAICGEVPAGVRRPEGPFGDHYGYYSWVHDFPVLNVKNVFHRKDAIYPATVVGKPRQEDYYIGEYLQRVLSPLFPVVMPGVKALWTYAETGFHALAGAIVRESYHREALAHAFRILGEGQLTLTKFLLVSDVQCDLQDFPSFFENILARFNPAQDLWIINDTSMDTLDYTGRKFNRGSKAIMTGLGKTVRSLPREYNNGEIAGIKKIKPYCGGCLLLSGASFEANTILASEVVRIGQEALADWPVVILVDDVDTIQDQTSFLWTVFTRFDPANDIYAQSEIVNNKIQYQGPVVIDARMKPWYPDELEPREDIKELVTKRWAEYFPK
ncbi:MAG TPA: UbiD family decarboxylase [Verrucomicrobiae bacterium]|nr:UbiD family decarboxylase [Verrucomicrobiae bacterium]